METLNITRGKIAKAQKVVIYGPEGIGKSTFISRFPGVVFIDTEGSTAHMDVYRTPAPMSWPMLLDMVKVIGAKAVPAGQVKTLAIDTADWAEMLCVRDICARRKWDGIEDAGYGKGYTYLEEEFGRLLNLLQQVVDAGCNVVLAAHAQMRKFEQPDEFGAYDRWELKLEKKTGALVKEWADMVLFANYETYVVKGNNPMEKNKAQGGRRVMYTTHHPCWDAKNRHGLRDKLPFDFAEIAACVPGAASSGGDATNSLGVDTERGRETTIPQSAAPTAPPPSLSPAATSLPAGESLPFAQGSLESTELSGKRHLPPQPEGAGDATSGEKSQGSAGDPEEKLAELMRQPNVTDADALPKALLNLMAMEDITPREVQHAVAYKGYFPDDTPLGNYPEDFVNGVLIGAWTQVKNIIMTLRASEGDTHER